MPKAPQFDGSVKAKILRCSLSDRHLQDDTLVAEEPIEVGIKAQGSLIDLGVMLRTPGDDRNLILGFLFNESLITTASELASLKFVSENETTLPATRVIATLQDHIQINPERHRRAFPISSACGACGKSALESLKIHREGSLPVIPHLLQTEILAQLSERLASDQSLFARTGGLHASGRFSFGGELLHVAEDVGRHNALDKLVGHALDTQQTDWSQHILVLSGRVGYDLMQKAIMIGCPIVASIGAPSSLAVELASLYKITLIGFLRPDRFNLYSSPERIKPTS